jgi:hypothetical protein
MQGKDIGGGLKEDVFIQIVAYKELGLNFLKGSLIVLSSLVLYILVLD